MDAFDLDPGEALSQASDSEYGAFMLTILMKPNVLFKIQKSTAFPFTINDVLERALKLGVEELLLEILNYSPRRKLTLLDFMTSFRGNSLSSVDFLVYILEDLSRAEKIEAVLGIIRDDSFSPKNTAFLTKIRASRTGKHLAFQTTGRGRSHTEVNLTPQQLNGLVRLFKSLLFIFSDSF